MNNDLERWQLIITRMQNSKRNWLEYIEWVDGCDSDEYELYDKWIQDREDLEWFFNEFYSGNPDRTLKDILNFIEAKEAA